MFIFLSLACLFVTYSGVNAADCHMREMDLCAATVMMAATEGFPGDDEEMDRFCEPVIEGMQCVGNYSNLCFTDVLKEIFEMVIEEPRQAQKQLCTPGTDERAQYLKNAACFQRAFAMDDIKPYLDDFMAAMEKATEVPFKERIPVMCCGVQTLFGTLVDRLKEVCGEAVMNEGSAMVGLPISSIQNMFCRGFERGSDTCKAALPPPGTQSKGQNSDNQLIKFISSAMASFT